MYVRIYRYHIHPDNEAAFRTLQVKADRIYRKHGDFKAHYLKSESDSTLWLEVHTFADRAACDAVSAGVDGDPEGFGLIDQFLALVDPAHPGYTEENFTLEFGFE